MTTAVRNAVDTATAHAQYSHLRRIRCRQRGHGPGPRRFPHPHPRRKDVEEFEWVRKEYLACEQMALGKIKEGVIMAIEHSAILQRTKELPNPAYPTSRHPGRTESHAANCKSCVK